MVWPRRTSFSHTGGPNAGPLTLAERPPSVWRYWNAVPLTVVGVAKNEPCRALSATPSRIIRPAFVHAFTLATEVTLAVIVKSPLIDLCAKLNSSALPQMSAPDPLTMKLWPSNPAEPAADTCPMSWSLHPGGSDPLWELSIVNRPDA